MKPTWKEQLHIAMEECRPADWYYKFISTLLSEDRTSLLKELEEWIRNMLSVIPSGELEAKHLKQLLAKLLTLKSV